MGKQPWADDPRHGRYVPSEKKLTKTLHLRLTESDFEILASLAQKENSTSVEFIRRLLSKELVKIS